MSSRVVLSPLIALGMVLTAGSAQPLTASESVGLIIGGGSRWNSPSGAGGLFDLGVRGDLVLATQPADDLEETSAMWWWGAVLRARSSSFSDLQLTLGPELLRWRGLLALSADLVGGWAFRRSGLPDGPVVGATLAGGLRLPIGGSDAGFALGDLLYLSARYSPVRPNLVEVSAGVELSGVLALLAIAVQ